MKERRGRKGKDKEKMAKRKKRKIIMKPKTRTRESKIGEGHAVIVLPIHGWLVYVDSLLD